MHCAICDKDDDSVTPYNPDCGECQEVIYDTIQSYDTLDEPPELELVDVDIENLPAI